LILRDLILNELKGSKDTQIDFQWKKRSIDARKKSIKINCVFDVEINSKLPENKLEFVFKSVENGGAYMTPKIARKVMDFFSGKKKVMDNLTEREVEIANTILEGLSYKMIGDKFGISLDTVREHVKNIYKKLSINSKSQLFNIFKK
jgi:DNA-binding NarL/FixJ family response regulator